MKYRKKPVVIDATQWFPGTDVEGVVKVRKTVPTFDEFDSPFQDFWMVNTLEGQMKVSPGDWIITGVKGERYPCKPDIFEMTYEAME